jgi:Xaa-Pro aminopeptidase
MGLILILTQTINSPILGLPDTPTQAAWLKKNLPAGAYVGVDPMLYIEDEWEQMAKELTGKHLTPLKQNLVDLIWKDRPSRPKKQLMELGLEFAGKSTSEKIRDIRKVMCESDSEIMVINELDEIACKLFNLEKSLHTYMNIIFPSVIINSV